MTTYVGYPLVRSGIALGHVPGLRALLRALAFLICGEQLEDESRAILNPLLILDFHYKTASIVVSFRRAFKGAQ